MNILLASSEVFPFSKTGGLADVVGALGRALAQAGHEVRVVTPLYRGIQKSFPQLKREQWEFNQPLGSNWIHGRLWSLEPENRLKIYFVKQPAYFDRAGIYYENNISYPDNAERYIFFSKCVVNLARYDAWKPDVIHVHDWQTSLVPALVLQQKREGWGSAPTTCLTIHNLAFQGIFAPEAFSLTNLAADFFSSDTSEYFGTLNFLKSGIALADVITTVSPRYAREIMTEEYGCGLDGMLRRRAKSLHGILNGVDYSEWNTTKNPHLFKNYSATDLSGKAINKVGVQKFFGLPIDKKIPLFGTISRLTEQKGVDIQLGALEEMLNSNMQFVLLGSGAPEFERGYRKLAVRFPDKVGVRFGYDETLAHRIEAGCDFFVMPSRFEPCGLNQMYSLRYGTIPIVRAVGGLDGSVVDFVESQELANGIKFFEYSAQALAKAIRKAQSIYASPALRLKFLRNGMKADFSWKHTISQYLKAYKTQSQ